MSKPMVVTLPFVLLLMDVWPLRRVPLDGSGIPNWRRRVAEKVPLLILGAVAIALTFMSQGEIGAVSPLDALPLSSRLADAVVSCVAYLGRRSGQLA